MADLELADWNGDRDKVTGKQSTVVGHGHTTSRYTVTRPELRSMKSLGKISDTCCSPVTITERHFSSSDIF